MKIYFAPVFFKIQSGLDGFGLVLSGAFVCLFCLGFFLLLLFVFILVLLGLSLLTDKYILPFLGKIILWKSANSGLRFQTK